MAAHDGCWLERESTTVYYESLSLKRATRDYERVVLSLPRGGRVLEIGCGGGENLIRYASAGLSTLGVDISGRLVAKARKALRAAGHDPGIATQMNAETLEFPRESFDLVCGRSILHHLTDLKAMAERVERVLRRRGSCVFLEPLAHNPMLAFYRRLTPRARTRDEHPLRRGDIRGFLSPFARGNLRCYLLCGLAASAAYFVTRSRGLFWLLDRLAYPLDRLVLGLPGPQRYLAFACVVQAWKGC